MSMAETHDDKTYMPDKTATQQNRNLYVKVITDQLLPIPIITWSIFQAARMADPHLGILEANKFQRAIMLRHMFCWVYIVSLYVLS